MNNNIFFQEKNNSLIFSKQIILLNFSKKILLFFLKKKLLKFPSSIMISYEIISSVKPLTNYDDFQLFNSIFSSNSFHYFENYLMTRLTLG